MMILAIDPGSKESAFIIFDTRNEKIINHGFVSNQQMLFNVREGIIEIEELIIESIEGFGMTAGQEIFDTCFWSGRFCQAFEERGGTFHRIGRKAIKLHLCGVTSAKDKDIRESLIYRYGIPGIKSAPGKLYGIAGHCWSALAVAVTYSDQKNKP